MKSIRIAIDESVLKELDAIDEVRRNGRSAVIGRAVALYLREIRRRTITERYRLAYGAGTKHPRLDEELAGWEDEQVWPKA